MKIIPKKLKFLLFMPARGVKKAYKTNQRYLKFELYF